MSDFNKSPDGKKNIYTCRACRGHIVTRDLCEGTTPFMIMCRATPECKGMMQSSLYRVFDATVAASHEWYKPGSMDGLTPPERQHVEMGGLLLREVSPVSAQVKLALRVEGNWWVARIGNGGEEIGRIAMAAVEDKKRRQAFIDLTSSFFGALIKDATGLSVAKFEERPAPEIERAGSA